MSIQSLSIYVPAACPNKCPFCVSKIHPCKFKNSFAEKEKRHYHKREYLDRLRYVASKGCDTIIFTGDGEPLSNQGFIEMVADMNEKLGNPFIRMELQTSGIYYRMPGAIPTNINSDAGLKTLAWMRNTVGLKTLSLSICNLDMQRNADILNMPEGVTMLNIPDTVKSCHDIDINVRLSFNMTKLAFMHAGRDSTLMPIPLFLTKIANLEVEQLTLRKMYLSDDVDYNLNQNEWVRENRLTDDVFSEILKHIVEHSRPLERLPFGAVRYSFLGMSTVVDDDCMSEKVKFESKYAILGPNCKLYSKWDDPASLIF